MRILLVTNSYPSVHSPSGAPYLSARVRALAAAGASVVAAALVPRYGPELALPRRLIGAYDNPSLALDSGDDGRRFRSATTKWTAIDVAAGRLGRRPESGIARASSAVLELPEVRAGTFDIVHAHGMYTLPAGEVGRRVASRLGVPFVVSMHGSDVTAVMPKVARAHVQTLRTAAATIYVSHALRDRAFALGAPTTRSFVIPNGVDLQVFFPGDQAPEAADESPRLLFVGNLLPVKGADRLPAILQAVRVRHPGATLDVVGSGPLESALARTPGLSLHGRLAPVEVAQAMQAASVVVVPSRAEGWGCVVSESYACGTPVIASAVGGLVEAVLDPAHLVTPSAGDDGNHGIAEAFADVLETLLREPPSLDRLFSHVQHSGWSDVTSRELGVLESALE